jgi:hypothetical protein
MRFLTLLVSLLFVCKSASGGEPWRLVRTVGMMQMVLVEQSLEKNQEIYRQAIKKLCSGKNLCFVYFWTDESLVPSAMPMTDTQSNALKANWSYNGNTGHRQLLWSCKIVSDPNQCFSN